MKFLCAFVALVAVAIAVPVTDEWEAYKLQYNKVYESNEVEAVRKAIYFQAKKHVEEHNKLFDAGLKSYSLAINHLADMLPIENAQKLNGYKMRSFNGQNPIHQSSNAPLPTSVDWRPKGLVTPIKDQGQCGSCWAFSTTGSLEGQHAKKTGKLVSLSEQQLVDCSGAEGNMGCDGGLMDSAFTYIKKNKGIDTEKSYGYTAEDGKCKWNKKNIGATVSGFVDIKSGNETDLQDAAATVGPISVAIDASSFDFQLYASGIYDEAECSTSELDHGVLVVGYGEDNGSAYWLVKNSWGTSWGLDGYIKMSKGKKNQCGIATEASYPLV